DGAVSSHDVILDLVAVIPGSNIRAIDPDRILDTRGESSAPTPQPPVTTPTPPAPTPPAPTPPTPPANPGDTRNCSDFSTYAEAKAWFDTYFPFYGDIANLDADGDGEPCESLPGGP
ncbi:MAG: excalibur calcium-binding domain-containing protein, partial [Actinomycetota bacterium]